MNEAFDQPRLGAQQLQHRFTRGHHRRIERDGVAEPAGTIPDESVSQEEADGVRAELEARDPRSTHLANS